MTEEHKMINIFQKIKKIIKRWKEDNGFPLFTFYCRKCGEKFEPKCKCGFDSKEVKEKGFLGHMETDLYEILH